MGPLAHDWWEHWLVQVDVGSPGPLAEDQHYWVQAMQSDPNPLSLTLAIPGQGANHAGGTTLITGTHHEDLPEETRVQVAW